MHMMPSRVRAQVNILLRLNPYIWFILGRPSELGWSLGSAARVLCEIRTDSVNQAFMLLRYQLMSQHHDVAIHPRSGRQHSRLR